MWTEISQTNSHVADDKSAAENLSSQMWKPESTGKLEKQTAEAAATSGVVIENAASYNPDAGVAPGSIGVAFAAGGTKLADVPATASTQPLPTRLGGLEVVFYRTNADGQTEEVKAPLFYVSPQQVNFQVPEGVTPDPATGKATAYFRTNGREVAADVAIKQTVPGIFSNDSTGQGAPSAQITSDGQNFTNVARFPGDKIGINVDAGSSDNPQYLVLYGTGLRHAKPGSVKIVFGEGSNAVELSPEYVGAQPNNAGLDQVNVRLDPRLRGRQNVNVHVIVDGKEANVTKLNFGS